MPPPSFKASVDGAAEMAKKIREIAAKFPKEVEAALYAEANVEMVESKRRVPVRYGPLKASGAVHEPEREGRQISVTLSYGDNAVDYAVYVHEDLTAFHKNGEAKFLESVLKESAPYMAERLAKRLHFDKWAK